MKGPKVPRGWRFLRPNEVVIAGDIVRCRACAREKVDSRGGVWLREHYWDRQHNGPLTVLECRMTHTHDRGGLEFARKVARPPGSRGQGEGEEEVAMTAAKPMSKDAKIARLRRRVRLLRRELRAVGAALRDDFPGASIVPGVDNALRADSKGRGRGRA